MRQTKFDFLNSYKKEFGGSLSEGKRKVARPLSTKAPIHLIIKSNGLPSSPENTIKKCTLFSPGNGELKKIIRTQADKYKIKIYDMVLNWSHIHLAVLIPSRAAYLAFIRTVTAKIIYYLSKLTKQNLAGLFSLRPYTRIISWGRELKAVLAYILLNQLEACRAIRRIKTNRRSRAKFAPDPVRQYL